MTAELDLARLEALPAALGLELPEIVATLVAELDRAVTSVEAALADGDLPAAALAAHVARNSALMLGAGSILDALEQLETRADAGQWRAAGAAVKRLRLEWPNLRSQLQQVAGGA
jgi:Hpt domain